MSISEQLSFIPLLLYGIAVADLFSHWRRFFHKEYLYWPYIITAIVLTELAIWNIYLFMISTKEMESVSYYLYWTDLIKPIIFLLLVHAFTPEAEDKDTEAYFIKRIPVVFGLLSLYIALHLAPDFDVYDRMFYPRIFAVVISASLAISRYVPIVYGIGLVWLISLFFR